MTQSVNFGQNKKIGGLKSDEQASKMVRSKSGMADMFHMSSAGKRMLLTIIDERCKIILCSFGLKNSF
jgi:hypothetical protein